MKFVLTHFGFDFPLSPNLQSSLLPSGIVAIDLINNLGDSGRKFAGNVIFGTNYPLKLETAKQPQLELAGELDMLSVANLAPVYDAFAQELVASTLVILRYLASSMQLLLKRTLTSLSCTHTNQMSAMASTKAPPVLVLDGINRGDFCPGYNFTGDIPSEAKVGQLGSFVVLSPDVFGLSSMMYVLA